VCSPEFSVLAIVVVINSEIVLLKTNTYNDFLDCWKFVIMATASVTQEARCNFCGNDKDLMDKPPKPRNYSYTDSSSSRTSKSIGGANACSTFCKGTSCMRKYGIYIKSKYLNLSNGIPYRFTESYPNKDPIQSQNVQLTCGYCGKHDENVVRNSRMKNDLYADFCKNAYCCSRYTEYIETKSFIPYVEREKLIKDWESQAPSMQLIFGKAKKRDDDMNWESNRLKSFVKWSSPFVTPSDLADAGFYSLQWENQVRCISCDICVGRWEEGDNVWTEHLKHSPHCDYIRGKTRQNYSIKHESLLKIEIVKK
jgi:Inhibitor of Apoptosis domain